MTDQLHALAVLFLRKESPLLIDWRLNDSRTVRKLRLGSISCHFLESNQHPWDISPLVQSIYRLRYSAYSSEKASYTQINTGVYISVRRVSRHLTRLYRLSSRQKPAVEVAPIKKRHCGLGTGLSAGCLSSWASPNNASAFSHVQIRSITRRWRFGC